MMNQYTHLEAGGTDFAQDRQPNKSFFPLLIKYSDPTKFSVVDTPDQIESGRSFTVLECNTNLEERVYGLGK